MSNSDQEDDKFLSKTLDIPQVNEKHTEREGVQKNPMNDGGEISKGVNTSGSPTDMDPETSTLTSTRDTINEKHERTSRKETSDQANIRPDEHTPNNENDEHHGTNITGPKVFKSYYKVLTAAPDTVSRYKRCKSPDSYVTTSILRSIMLGILSCMGLLIFLSTLAPAIACQGAGLTTRVLGEATQFSVLRGVLDKELQWGPRIFKDHGNITRLVNALLN